MMGIGEVSMSLISERIIEEFGGWAKENGDKSAFPKIYETEKSYYTNRNPKEAYLMEYSFGNMAELKKALEVYSGLAADLQILEKLTVEVCKNRSSHAVEIMEDKDSLLQMEKLFAEEPVKLPVKADRDLKKEKVIEEFQTWAKKNKDNTVFSEISKEEDSYYSNKNSEETYLIDYSFQNMAELKEALVKYSGLLADSQILKCMTVEICQHRFEKNLKMHKNVDNREKKEEVYDSQKILPEFVYVF